MRYNIAMDSLSLEPQQLAAFRERVREMCRRANPYGTSRKPGLADLAAAIGLSRAN